jgi:hypothetical protein
MNPDPQHRAILFVDISGSTQLYEQLGDAQALARVETCLRLLQRVTEELGGQVVKSTGDGLMCAFDDATPACRPRRCTAGVRAARAGRPDLAIHGLPLRVGDRERRRLLWRRGERRGARGRVASRPDHRRQDVIARLEPALRTRRGCSTASRVKGKREPVQIHELVWQDSEELTMLGTRLTEERERVPRLRLAFGVRELWFDGSGAGAVTLGRDAACDIVLDDRKASRQHAKIERRRDKFVLVDHSSNGTFVEIVGESELGLRREEMILRLHGRIALGHRTSDPEASVVEFSCE